MRERLVSKIATDVFEQKECQVNFEFKPGTKVTNQLDDIGNNFSGLMACRYNSME